jgi:hypothetical protein
MNDDVREHWSILQSLVKQAARIARLQAQVDRIPPGWVAKVFQAAVRHLRRRFLRQCARVAAMGVTIAESGHTQARGADLAPPRAAG